MIKKYIKSITCFQATIVFPYESGDQVIEVKPEGTYTDENAKVEGVEYWWNHGISKTL